MSIRWRDERPIVEVYDPTTKKKRHIKPADFGLDFRPLQGRALERAAKQLELAATETLAGGRGADELCDSFAARWADDFRGTEARPRGESTRIINQQRVGKFGEDFAGRTMRSIDKREARTWAQAHPYRAQAVRTMFNDALEEGLCDTNPFARLGMVASQGRRDIVVLTYDEIHQLADHALDVWGPEFGSEVRAMVLWGAFTCLRPGETFAARHSLLHGDTYDVQSQWNSHLRRETAPKYGSDGMVFVPEPAREAVNGKPRRIGDDLMFRTARGKQFRRESWHYTWAPLRAAFTATLPAEHHLRRREEALDFHELRHFGASYMLNRLNIEPWVIAEQLRHTDGGNLVVRLYGHPERSEAIDRIRGAYGENVKTLGGELAARRHALGGSSGENA